MPIEFLDRYEEAGVVSIASLLQEGRSLAMEQQSSRGFLILLNKEGIPTIKYRHVGLHRLDAVYTLHIVSQIIQL